MDSKLLWTPTEKQINESNLTDFISFINSNYNTSLVSYHDLWKWSVDDINLFWQSIYDYYNIIDHGKAKNVVSPLDLPFNKWFEGSLTNYTEHVFRNENTEFPAIIFKSECVDYLEFSWSELKAKVAKLANYLRSKGIGKGDCVVAYLPNIPEATIGFLATNSIGAIWSSCSPDFGNQSVINRFEQIQPKVFIFTDGYQYNGKTYSRAKEVEQIIKSIDSIKINISIDYIGEPHNDNYKDWDSVLQGQNNTKLIYEYVESNHPIWVLYSSGTTGMPKSITHGGLGILLEHYKYMSLQADVKKGDRFFWYSTTGWMMWNFVQSSLLVGGTVVLYDGSPGYPNFDVLWEFTETAKINHFGTSAPYLLACIKKGVKPSSFDLSSLISIGSTGSPLPPEAFDWVYKNIKDDVWLTSMSGGTDVCTAFVGGNILEPVYMGEIQGRCLGCDLDAWDDSSNSLDNEVGEMVIKKPMPSMPIFFWNDKDNSRYYDSYYNHFKDIWRHGDWVKITPHNSVIILGRSDATLNRHGIRIGTAEIYNVIEQISEIKDSLVVNLELDKGKHYMPLFIVLNEGCKLDEALIKKVVDGLKKKYTPRHVPDEMIIVDDLPYTISGKKMEAPVKKILLGIDKNKASSVDSMRNPESLAFFEAFALKIKNK